MKKNDLPFPEQESKNKNNGKLLFESGVTKSEIKRNANEIVSLVDSGENGAIEVFLKARAMKELCDEVIESLKEKVSDAIISIHHKIEFLEELKLI